MHSARQNFIKAESSEQLKRPFRYQVRMYSEENYEAENKVYYKRKSTKGWRGPAKVLRKDILFS